MFNCVLEMKMFEFFLLNFELLVIELEMIFRYLLVLK